MGDVFEDEAAGELQLRYMACLDGVPLDKAARTHEKLRTLSELMAPFSSPRRQDGLAPISIEVSTGWCRCHDVCRDRDDRLGGIACRVSCCVACPKVRCFLTFTCGSMVLRGWTLLRRYGVVMVAAVVEGKTSELVQ